MADAQITPEVAKGLVVGLVEADLLQGQNLPPSVYKALRAYQNGQAEESLQILAGNRCPYTEKDVERILLEMLSSQKRDQNTGLKKEPRLGTPEKDRYDRSLQIAQAVREYLESNGQNIPQVLQNEILVYLINMPQFKDILFDQKGFLRTQQAQDLIKVFLSQPRLIQAMHRLFTERLDPEKRLKYDSIVADLESEIKKLEAQIIDPQKIDAEIAQRRTELTQKKTAIYRDQNYNDYSDALQKLEDAQQELRELEDDYQVAKKSKNNSQIQQTLQEINNKRAEIRKFQNYLNDPKFSNIHQLQQEESLLQSQIQLLEQQKLQANTPEQKQLRTQFEEKLLELQEAQAKLIVERIKYATDVIAIPADAAKKFLNEALGEVAIHYKEEAKKAAEQEEAHKKLLEEQAIEKLGRRLGRREKTRNGETIFVPNKREAKRFLTLLFHPSGFQEFINEVARDESTLTSYGLSREEAQTILARKKDPKFVETFSLNLAKKILCDYLLAGGRLSRDEIFALSDTDWGRSIIEDGLKLAEEKKKFVESQLGKGVLTFFDASRLRGGKTGEWLKGNWWKIGGTVLLILLVGLVGPSLFQSASGLFSSR